MHLALLFVGLSPAQGTAGGLEHQPLHAQEQDMLGLLPRKCDLVL